MGSIQVEAELEGNKKELPLIVVKGQAPSLLGRNWISQLEVNWKSTHKLENTDSHSQPF